MNAQKMAAVFWVAGLGFLLCQRTSPAAAPEVGAPADVAPGVEGTQQQRWPRAAWCEGAKCWLVVWREGEYCEQETDIWCARFGADGKALDPAGIRLTSAKGVQDRPVVASDGKGFLVLWNDFRSGKDWDVYAGRVTADGKALDPDGVLLAGGEHNQCFPTVAFAGGNYLVVWQAWIGEVIESKGVSKKFGSYGLRGNRISPDGKALDGEGKVLADVTAVEPSLASDGGGGVHLVWFGRADRRLSGAGGLSNLPIVARIDAAKVELQGAATPLAIEKSTINGKQNHVPGLVWLPDKGAMMSVRGYKGGTTVYRVDANGRKVGECAKMHNYAYDEIDAFASLAISGDRVLFTQDWPSTSPKKPPVHLGVWGWILSTDGKVLEGGEEGFALAAEPDKDRMQGFACAGPAGEFLIVYAEARGPDDTKVVARVVK